MRKISVALGVLNTSYGTSCGQVSDSCERSCENAIESAREAGFDRKQKHDVVRFHGDCIDFSQKLAGPSMMQAANAVNTFVGSQMCIDAANTLVDPTANFCLDPVNFESPICTGHMADLCEDPAQKQTMYCVCTVINPQDPKCVGYQLPSDALTQLEALKDPRAGAGTYGKGNSGFGAEQFDGKAVAGNKGDGGGVPDRQGGALLSSSGGGSNAPGAGGGGSGNENGPFNTDIMHGTSSGGGGGGFVSNSGSYNRGGGSGGGSAAGKTGSLFDLKKFLPGASKDPSRSIAGMSIQAKDGMTGPLGPTIWQKVSTQYNKQKPSLQP